MQTIPDNVTTSLPERVASGLTYGSSAGAVATGVWNLNTIMLLVGIVVPIVALIGNMAISIYFKQKRLELEREIASRTKALPSEEEA